MITIHSLLSAPVSYLLIKHYELNVLGLGNPGNFSVNLLKDLSLERKNGAYRYRQSKL